MRTKVRCPGCDEKFVVLYGSEFNCSCGHTCSVESAKISEEGWKDTDRLTRPRGDVLQAMLDAIGEAELCVTTSGKGDVEVLLPEQTIKWRRWGSKALVGWNSEGHLIGIRLIGLAN